MPPGFPGHLRRSVAHIVGLEMSEPAPRATASACASRPAEVEVEQEGCSGSEPHARAMHCQPCRLACLRTPRSFPLDDEWSPGMSDSQHGPERRKPSPAVEQEDGGTVHNIFGDLPAGAPAPEMTPEMIAGQQRLTVTMQALFRDNALSLADPETVKVYRTSLDAFRLILQGPLRAGRIDEEQHDLLMAMLGHAELVPDWL